MFDAIDVTKQETWIKTFTLNHESTGAPLGDFTYYAEFVLLDPHNHANILIRASTTNGQVAWASPGVVTVTFTDAQTAMFMFPTADFYLKIKQPVSNIATIALSGSLNVFEPSGGQVPVHPLYQRGPSGGMYWNGAGYMYPWCCGYGGAWMSPGINVPMPYPLAS